MDLLGVDVGGTKVSVCLGDTQGNIIAHKRVYSNKFKAIILGTIATQTKEFLMKLLSCSSAPLWMEHSI
jgi:predicted NBD/HSP70 family sugar kinase